MGRPKKIKTEIRKTDSKIESELLTVMGIEGLPEYSNDDSSGVRSKYLIAVARKAANIEEDAWDKLTEPAQEWVSGCVAEIREGKTKDITDFPDRENSEAEPVEEPKAEVVEESETVEPETTTEPKKPVSKRGPRSTKPGTSLHFRTLILQNPKDDKEALMKRSEADGYPIPKGSASTIYYETHTTLNLMEKLGLI